MATPRNQHPISSDRSVAYQWLISPNLRKILNIAEDLSKAYSAAQAVLALGLKIRVSLVQFHPWPPLNQKVTSGLAAFSVQYFEASACPPRLATVDLLRRAWIIVSETFGSHIQFVIAGRFSGMCKPLLRAIHRVRIKWAKAVSAYQAIRERGFSETRIQLPVPLRCSGLAAGDRRSRPQTAFDVRLTTFRIAVIEMD